MSRSGAAGAAVPSSSRGLDLVPGPWPVRQWWTAAKSRSGARAGMQVYYWTWILGWAEEGEVGPGGWDLTRIWDPGGNRVWIRAHVWDPGQVWNWARDSDLLWAYVGCLGWALELWYKHLGGRLSSIWRIFYVGNAWMVTSPVTLLEDHYTKNCITQR
ncbi:hypothetical protein RchiOBHm_Chr4g0422981 [Rosa chinensis]|uniref:Uncharacterized protein n=1 Tax=Rosa chinensis TaxID=74649 RepID=A0A2P6QYI8_ROSCH|nr:hypothetical protein RchiOBHm_Chr4g0422981 [Rosa chinensis]